MTEYKPRGRVLAMLAAIEAEPARVFTAAECAQIMDCDQRTVGAYMVYAVRSGRVCKTKVGRQANYSGLRPENAPPLPKRGRQQCNPKIVASTSWMTDPDDPRIGKVVPGWKPPQMVCVRSA